jgi:hypothetical protein
MKRFTDKKGLLAFGIIVTLFVIGALAAYQITGHMGVEERFHTAVGIPPGNEGEESGGWSGAGLEGNPVFYGIVLGALAVICYAMYRYFSV